MTCDELRPRNPHFDKDNRVLILSANFGLSGTEMRDPRADIDENGMIDFPDFLALSAAFGEAQDLEVVAIPEPSASCLLVSSLAVGLLRRRSVTLRPNRD
jgi:hypothetical protein